MKLNRSKLKPCPFCGGEAKSIKVKLQIPYDKDGYYIECHQCGTHSDLYLTEQEAIEAWNTRKPMDRIVEQLEEEKNCGMDLIDTEYAIEIVKAGGRP